MQESLKTTLKTDNLPQEITCNKCQEIFSLDDNVTMKDLGIINNRHWLQAGITCPHCKTFFHSFYTHDKLEKRKKKLKKMTGTRFNIEQQRIKQYHIQIQQEAQALFN